MDFYNKYRPIELNNLLSHTLSSFSSPYSPNQNNNNYKSVYSESNSENYKTKKEISSNNYVKKPFNLDISPSINNSFNEQKKENISFLRKYSSFSNSDNISNKQIEKNKKTLILDLDETLVHSAFTPFRRKSDITLNINIEGENRTLYVLKRPYVDKFLTELSEVYEILIFTASISQYANPLLDELDKSKCIKNRYFREHCTFTNGIYIKDLKIFDRKINNMIIIDNNPISYDNNIENGIPILSWYDNINDNELLKLLPILKYMSNSNVNDVRNIINQIVDRNKNEINYIAINKIINIRVNNEEEKNCLKKSNLTIENNYRKKNKSQEPKRIVSNMNNIGKIENNKINKEKGNNPLKNNYAKNYNIENARISNKNKRNINYNQNLYNNYNKEEKEQTYFKIINIDKMDPKGTRTSIFSPEEYNISYTKKYKYKYSFNNTIEEEKNNLNMKARKDYTDYLNNQRNKYCYDSSESKRNNDLKSLTPNIDNRRKSELSLNKEDYLNSSKISKKNSLVELTKRALHLVDDPLTKNKEHEFGTINSEKEKTLYKYNNYFSKENDIIYNDYINNKNNQYLSVHKTTNDFNKEPINNLYFNKYSEKSKNLNEYNDNEISKRINSFNERFINTDKYLYNNVNRANSNKLLYRMNNEKINTFLNFNKANYNSYQDGNFFNNFNSQNKYMQNISKINKDNYFKGFKKPLIQNKNNINNNAEGNKKEILKNSHQNYLNNEKNRNSRYDFLNNFESNDTSNSILRHNSISYNNQKRLSFKNLKKSIKKNNEQPNLHQILRSSSYIYPNSEIDTFSQKFSLNNKENYNNNNFDFEYGKNLNYKYELINPHNKPKFMKNINKYSNNFNELIF